MVIPIRGLNWTEGIAGQLNKFSLSKYFHTFLSCQEKVGLGCFFFFLNQIMVLFLVGLFLFFWKVFVLRAIEKLSSVFSTRDWRNVITGCVAFGVYPGLLALTVLPSHSNLRWSSSQWIHEGSPQREKGRVQQLPFSTFTKGSTDRKQASHRVEANTTRMHLPSLSRMHLPSPSSHLLTSHFLFHLGRNIYSVTFCIYGVAQLLRPRLLGSNHVGKDF